MVDAVFSALSSVYDYVSWRRRNRQTRQKTVLVTGAKGLLGKTVYKTLQHSGKWGKIIGTTQPAIKLGLIQV